MENFATMRNSHNSTLDIINYHQFLGGKILDRVSHFMRDLKFWCIQFSPGLADLTNFASICNQILQPIQIDFQDQAKLCNQ